MRRRVLRKSDVLREGYNRGLRKGMAVLERMLMEAEAGQLDEGFLKQMAAGAWGAIKSPFQNFAHNRAQNKEAKKNKKLAKQAAKKAAAYAADDDDDDVDGRAQKVKELLRQRDEYNKKSQEAKSKKKGLWQDTKDIFKNAKKGAVQQKVKDIINTYNSLPAKSQEVIKKSLT